MANVAERLYEHFLQHSLDFMLLFYLRHPNLMNDNSLCKKLSKCLKDFCVRDQDMSSVDFRTKFFNSLRAKLSPGLFWGVSDSLRLIFVECPICQTPDFRVPDTNFTPQTSPSTQTPTSTTPWGTGPRRRSSPC